MEIVSKDRNELKSYFITNAKPSAGDFADLVDGMLNLKDDGVGKTAGAPLALEAAGDDTSPKETLHFYESFTDESPAWVLSLHPRSNPADAASAAKGFSISDGTGHSRLFVQPNGNVGVGTTTPADKLTVKDGDLRIEGGRYRRLKIVSDQYWAGIELVAREDGEAGNPHIDFTHGELDVTNYGMLLFAPYNDLLQIDGGPLKIDDGLRVDGDRSTHLTADGSFYRYSGQVYINVDDNLYIRDSTDGTRFHFNTNNGYLYATSYQIYSDARLKEGIRKLSRCLERLLSLDGKRFRWKDTEPDSPERVGFVAQEVEQVFPELVTTDTNGMRSIDYAGLIAPIVEAIKEQQELIESLRREPAVVRSAVD